MAFCTGSSMAMQPQSRARSLADLSKMERLDGYSNAAASGGKVQAKTRGNTTRAKRLFRRSLIFARANVM